MYQNEYLWSKGLNLTLSHTILSFNDPERKSLFKTLWEKDKMLIPSIFSVSHKFSTQSKRNFSVQATFSLSSANAFKFDQSKILLSGKELTVLSHCDVCERDFVLSCSTLNFCPFQSNSSRLINEIVDK